MPWGFSQKTCLPASTAALSIVRDGMRGRRDQHHVHAAGEQLLVGVEADEAMVVLHLDLVGLGLLELVAAGLEALVEDVGHGDEADVLAGVHGVDGGLGAAPAAADQADADDVAAGGVGAAFERERAQAAVPARVAEVRRNSRRVVGWIQGRNENGEWNTNACSDEP